MTREEREKKYKQASASSLVRATQKRAQEQEKASAAAFAEKYNAYQPGKITPVAPTVAPVAKSLSTDAWTRATAAQTKTPTKTTAPAKPVSTTTPVKTDIAKQALQMDDTGTFGSISSGLKKAGKIDFGKGLTDTADKTVASATKRNRESAAQKMDAVVNTTAPRQSVQMEKAKVDNRGKYGEIAKTRFGLGNIDLTDRPKIKNEDGSYSTLDSFSQYDDRIGKEVLVPTVIKQNGVWKHVDQNTAWQHYLKTGEYLGAFDDWKDADVYANYLHVAQQKQYDLKRTPTTGDDYATLSENGVENKPMVSVQYQAYYDSMTDLERRMYDAQPTAERKGKYLESLNLEKRVRDTEAKEKAATAQTLEKGVKNAAASESRKGQSLAQAMSMKGGKDIFELSFVNRLNDLTDTERSTLQAYADARDYAHLEEYWKAIETRVNARHRESEDNAIINALANIDAISTADDPADAWGAATAFAAYNGTMLGTGVLNALGTIPGAVYGVDSMIRDQITGEYHPVDYNNAAFTGVAVANALSQGNQAMVENNVNEMFGKGSTLSSGVNTVLNTIWSGGSSGITNGLQLSLGMALGLEGAALEQFTLGLMTAGSLGSTMYDELKDGRSNSTALTNAVVSGAIEYATEKLFISDWIENLGKLDDIKHVTKKQLFDQMKARMGAEATEEIIGNIAGQTWDMLYNGENSVYSSLWKEIKEYTGVSEEKAKKKAWLKLYAAQSLEAAASAALSVFFMDIIPSTQKQFSYGIAGRNIRSGNTASESTIWDSATAARGQKDAQGSILAHLYDDIQKKGGIKKASNRELGRLAYWTGDYATKLVNQGLSMPGTEAHALAHDALQYATKNYGNGAAINGVTLTKLSEAIEKAKARAEAQVDQATADRMAEEEAASNAAVETADADFAENNVNRDNAIKWYKDAIPGVQDKTVEKKADIIDKLFNGEEITQDDVNSLTLQNPKMRGVFERITGADLSGIKGKITPENLAQAVTEASAASQNASSAEGDTESTPTEKTVESAKDVTLDDFAKAYAEQNEDADRQTIEKQYNRLQADGVTAQVLGERVNFKQFYDMVRGKAEFADATAADIAAYFTDLVERQRVDGMTAVERAKYLQEVEAYKESSRQIEEARVKSLTEAAAHLEDVLNRNFSTTNDKYTISVETDGQFAYNENGYAKLNSREIHLNANKITTPEMLDLIVGHELLHTVGEEGSAERKAFVDSIIQHMAEANNWDESYIKKMENRYINLYSKHLGDTVSTEYAREEWAADLMGDIFRSRDITAQLDIGTLEDAHGIVGTLKTAFQSKKSADLKKAAKRMDATILDALRKQRAAGTAQTTESNTGNAADRRSISTVFESVNLDVEYKDGDGYLVIRNEDGDVVNEVTESMIRKSPLGATIKLSEELGRIKKGAGNKQIKFYADMLTQLIRTQDIDMLMAVAGTIGFAPVKRGSKIKSDRGIDTKFTGYTPNSDPQYKTTVDFTTICLKTQAVIDAMSKTMRNLDHGLTEDEIVKIVYKNTHEAGEPVPCPVCYVFARWVGLGGLFDNMAKWQEQYADMTNDEIREQIASLDGDIGDIIRKARLEAEEANRKAVEAGEEPKDVKELTEGRARTKLLNNSVKDVRNIKKNALKDARADATEQMRGLPTEANLSKKAKQEGWSQQEIDDRTAELLDQKAQLQQKINEIKANLKNNASIDAVDADTLALTEEQRVQMDELNRKISILDKWSWLTNVRLAEKYRPVPHDILFDINKGNEFARDYKESWKFRTTRGPAMGKAAAPYNAMHLGQIITGNNGMKDLGKQARNKILATDKYSELTDEGLAAIDKAEGAVKAQNLVNGQRMQSTSDFRFEYALDYLLAFMDLQVLGSKVQLYTKVPEAVGFLATCGAEVNLSLMPEGVGYAEDPNGPIEMNGKRYVLKCSSITGMNDQDAFGLTKRFDNVQTIMVGTSVDHIKLCMASPDIQFIIPYHASGASEGRYKSMMEILDEAVEKRDDFSNYQTDRKIKTRSKTIQNKRSARKNILTGKVLSADELNAIKNDHVLRELYKRFKGEDIDGVIRPLDQKYLEPSQRRPGEDVFYDDNCLGVKMKGDVADMIFPFEYWDKTTTIDTADENGRAFVDYCDSLGIRPRFSGYASAAADSYDAEKDFSKLSGYWKMLIDRRMYNNDGSYHEQKAVDVTKMDASYFTEEGYEQSRAGLNNPSRLNDTTKTVAIADKSAREIAAQRGEEYVDKSDWEWDEATAKMMEKRLSVDEEAREQVSESMDTEDSTLSDVKVRSSLRMEDPPKKTRLAYKAFYAYEGKLYPPMVSNLSDTERADLKGAVSGTLKMLDTPVGVWIDADVGKLGRYTSDATEYDVAFRKFWKGDSKALTAFKEALIADGIDLSTKEGRAIAKEEAYKRIPRFAKKSRTKIVEKVGDLVRNESGRLAVVNAKGGDTLAFRPGWHLGEWPDAKQFNKDSKLGKKTVMPRSLVFCLCEIAADEDYQMRAMELGMKKNGKFNRTMAGLPQVPVNGFYKYRTNANPNTAPWYITGSMRVLEILDDDDCARICAEHGVKPSPREDFKPIDLAEFGLKRGPVTPTADLTPYALENNNALAANNAELQKALMDENYTHAYTPRPINFDDPNMIKEMTEVEKFTPKEVQAYRDNYQFSNATYTGSFLDGKTKKRYSIETSADGSKYVDVDAANGRFTGVSNTEAAKEAVKAINELFADGPIPLGKDGLVNLRKATKGASKYAYDGSFMADSDYQAKMKAAANINEMLEAAEFIRHSDDHKNHWFATDGFDYYGVRFLVNGRMYYGVFNIGISDVGMTFYGMTDVQEIRPGENRNVAGNAVLPTGQSIYHSGADNLTANVAQPGAEVNRHSSISPEAADSLAGMTGYRPKVSDRYLDADGNEIYGNVPDLGAANAGFDPYTALQNTYGTMEPGENPVRTVDVPEQIDDVHKVSRAARTMPEAAATPDSRLQSIEDAVVNGNLAYISLPNRTMAARAYNKVATDFKGSYREFMTAAAEGKTGADLVALGATLINEVGNSDASAEEYIDLITAYAQMTTNTAQGLQAQRILKTLTPDAQLYVAIKQADRINGEIRKRRQDTKRMRHAKEDAGDAVKQAREDAAEDIRKPRGKNDPGMRPPTHRNASRMADEFQRNHGIPVEEWMNEVGKRVADSLGRKDARPTPITRIIQSDILSFAKQYAEPMSQPGQKRTATDTVRDLFRNRENYTEAWDSVKNRIREKYANDQDALDHFESLMDGTLTGENAEESVILSAIAEAALTEDTKSRDIVMRAGLSSVDQTAARIYNSVKARLGIELNDADAQTLRDAAKRFVENQIEANKPFDQMLKTDINKAIRDVKVRLSDLLVQGDVSKRAMADHITRVFMQDYGFYGEEAAQAAQIVVDAYNVMVAEASEERLDRMFAEHPTKEAKRIQDRFAELANLGAFTSNEWNSPAMAKIFGDDAATVTISPDLIDRFRKAKDDQERSDIMSEIQKDIARQIPVTFADRYTALRYTAMLGNFRTIIRNDIGNAAFQPVVFTKDAVAALLEKTLPASQRTKTVTYNRSDYNDAAKDFDSVRDVIMGGGKYNDRQTFMRGIEDERKIFGQTGNALWDKSAGAALELWRKKTGDYMDWGDAIFSKHTYAATLARYLKAQHVTMETATEKQLMQGRSLAIKAAAEATYRDNNQFSELITKIGFKHPDSFAQKAANAVIGGILPFKKTPANILVRAEEYSPLGLVNAAVQSVQSSKADSEVTGNDVINSLAKSLTGTGLLLLGYMLAQAGHLVGKKPDDDKEAAFWELQGGQEYSLKIGDNYYTIDWLAPEAIPMFIGANAAQAFARDGVSVSSALTALSSISDPLISMSMLQGVNDMLENASSYGDDGYALPRTIGNALWSMATQPVPTILGQAERAFNNTRQTTYVDKGLGVNNGVQRALGKLSAKVPGWDYNQIPYIDAWGRTETNFSSSWSNAIGQFISPSYASYENSGMVENEIQRLYDATGENTVLPQRAPTYFNVKDENGNNVRRNLNAGEYVAFATYRGQMAYKAMQELVNSVAYAQLTDAGKVEAIEKVYKLANSAAKEYIDPRAEMSSSDKATLGITSVPMSSYMAMQGAVSDIQSIKDKNGKTITNSHGLRILQYLYDNPDTKGLSKSEFQTLASSLGVGKTVLKYSKSKVESELRRMKKQAGKG